VRRLLFDERLDESRWLLRKRNQEFKGALREGRERLAHAGGPGLEAKVRAGWAAATAADFHERPQGPTASWTSRVDRVLLHGLFGPLIALALLLLLFQSLFSWAQPAMDLIDQATTRAAAAIHVALPDGALASLLADGVVSGVGAVLIFLPQIVLLFLFLGLLEDSGYMPRAAFLADSLFRGCGLTGRSLIPLLSSFACAVPGIMATRTIDQRSQRFLTIAVAPLVTCSARLPVYAVLIAAFVPATPLWGFFILQGLALAAMYLLGLATAGPPRS
jgi:ferrous iron transport protein B